MYLFIYIYIYIYVCICIHVFKHPKGVNSLPDIPSLLALSAHGLWPWPGKSPKLAGYLTTYDL